MNSVIIFGRLTADPDKRYGAQSNMAVTTFTVAVDRGDKNKTTDFIRCKAFDKSAEMIADSFRKGSRILISGSIQTGSYKDKDGKTVYTTDVAVNRFDFVDPKLKDTEKPNENEDMNFMDIPDDEDGIPFN